MSGLGKGITAASLGKILTARGFSVNIQKLDQYLNFDAGTLNPAEHGEVYVTADGAETDLDLGHYERFIDRELDQSSSVMTGRILRQILDDERAGKYLGKTVQIIPHVTGEIQRHILEASHGFDVQITEIGGTVGDYEGLALVEAVRQLRQKVGAENVMYAHVVFVPYLGTSKEMKTKPAQNSVRGLREVGIQVDLLCVRSDNPLNEDAYEKLSLYCDVDPNAIVALPTVKTVYQVPLSMEQQGIGKVVCQRLGLVQRAAELENWSALVDSILRSKKIARIGLVAKYLSNEDTYKSVCEAIHAAGWYHSRNTEIVWIDAEELEADVSALQTVEGIVVPGGFGKRGVEGKIKAIEYARLNNLPFLGLCLGMQAAVIEFARNVAGLEGAHSTEFNPDTQYPVIDILPGQSGKNMGGTMRLGNYTAQVRPDSRTEQIYGVKKITERHRHRYEFNNEYAKKLSDAGLIFAAKSADNSLVEMIELDKHPFFVASQFHPEFLSRPNRPHPLFREFIGATIKNASYKPTANCKSNKRVLS
ncbi:CTP synthase [Candidatus Saccharibacteria bacterium]|nr:CTP synthase [Candidatus Saccharibacteria bacterium]